MEIAFNTKEQLSPTIWTFYFSKPPGFLFDPGDYVELSLQYGTNKLGGRRWFTISASPTEDRLHFTVRIPPFASDYKQALMRLKPGSVAEISPPIGTFNPTNQQMVWVAGGIGITPYRSMALAVDEDQLSSTTLIHSARRGEFIFEDIFTNQSLAYLQEPEAITTYPMLESRVDNLAQRTIYISGAQNICQSLYEDSLEHGHPRQQLKLDYFPGYSGI